MRWLAKARRAVPASGGSPAWRGRLLVEESGVVIKEVLLPGIGVRYEFACRSGDRIGIIARRGGVTLRWCATPATTRTRRARCSG